MLEIEFKLYSKILYPGLCLLKNKDMLHSARRRERYTNLSWWGPLGFQDVRKLLVKLNSFPTDANISDFKLKKNLNLYFKSIWTKYVELFSHLHDSWEGCLNQFYFFCLIYTHAIFPCQGNPFVTNRAVGSMWGEWELLSQKITHTET